MSRRSGGVVALVEPFVDRRQHLDALAALAAAIGQPGKAGGGPEFERPRLLPSSQLIVDPKLVA